MYDEFLVPKLQLATVVQQDETFLN